MKLQLVSPKHTESGVATNPPRPPIGLEILAASVESRFLDDGRKIEIEIFDGEITPAEIIVARLDADVVGFSSLFSNHRECLALAKIAKQRGAKVVFGGPNATHLADRLLRNHRFIDWVVIYDGEVALPQLLLQGEPSSVPNVVSRNGIAAKHTRVMQVDVERLPLFTLEHIHDREKYFTVKEPFPVCIVRGCAKAMGSGRCLYCSIPTSGVRVLSPQRAWKQMRALNGTYGIDHFFEAGDSFFVKVPAEGNSEADVGDRLYPVELLRAKPGDFDVSLRIYERPDAIDRGRAKVLKDLGVTEVFLGYEHVDEAIRSRSNRPPLGIEIWDALEVLEDQGIQVVLAFMYGLPGEATASAWRNHEFAERAVGRFGNIAKLFVSVAIPLVGSTLFELLCADIKIVEKYDRRGHSLAADDVLDYDLLADLMVRHYCHIAPSELARVVEATRALVPVAKRGSFGQVKLME